MDLGYLGKTDDHKLDNQSKIDLLFLKVFGTRQGGKIIKPGLLHLLEGIITETEGLVSMGIKQVLEGYEVHIKDKDGKDTPNGMKYPGLNHKVEILGMQITAFGDQMTAMCRKVGIKEDDLVEFIMDTTANNTYLQNLGLRLKEHAEKRQKEEESTKDKLKDFQSS